MPDVACNNPDHDHHLAHGLNCTDPMAWAKADDDFDPPHPADDDPDATRRTMLGWAIDEVPADVPTSGHAGLDALVGRFNALSDAAGNPGAPSPTCPARYCLTGSHTHTCTRPYAHPDRGHHCACGDGWSANPDELPHPFRQAAVDDTECEVCGRDVADLLHTPTPGPAGDGFWYVDDDGRLVFPLPDRAGVEARAIYLDGAKYEALGGVTTAEAQQAHAVLVAALQPPPGACICGPRGDGTGPYDGDPDPDCPEHGVSPGARLVGINDVAAMAGPGQPLSHALNHLAATLTDIQTRLDGIDARVSEDLGAVLARLPLNPTPDWLPHAVAVATIGRVLADGMTPDDVITVSYDDCGPLAARIAQALYGPTTETAPGMAWSPDRGHFPDPHDARTRAGVWTMPGERGPETVVLPEGAVVDPARSPGATFVPDGAAVGAPASDGSTTWVPATETTPADEGAPTEGDG